MLEAILAIIVLSIAFGAILNIAFISLQTSQYIEKAARANFFIKEEMEALRNFRDGTTWATNGLGTMQTGAGNPYHMVLNFSTNPPSWTMAQGAETAGIFSKKIILDLVSRNPADQSIESTYNSLHNDANTRKATVQIVWEGRTVQASTYFTNWK